MLSFPFFYKIGESFGIISDYAAQKEQMLFRVWPNHYYLFNGLVSNLVFDIGYFFSLIFSIGYFIVVRKFSPIQGNMSINRLLMLTILAPMSIMCIFNSWMNTITYNFVLLYALVIYVYLNFTKKY
jgi:uncharacterized membrane protein YagU involved in acid resistance